MKIRISLFWSVVLTVVGLYLLLALLAPTISMLLVGRDEPLEDLLRLLLCVGQFTEPLTGRI